MPYVQPSARHNGMCPVFAASLGKFELTDNFEAIRGDIDEPNISSFIVSVEHPVSPGDRTLPFLIRREFCVPGVSRPEVNAH